MTDPEMGLEVSICENCNSPKLRLERVGGESDGESISICLTPEAYVQLTARLIYIGRMSTGNKSLRHAVQVEIMKLMQGGDHEEHVR